MARSIPQVSMETMLSVGSGIKHSSQDQLEEKKKTLINEQPFVAKVFWDMYKNNHSIGGHVFTALTVFYEALKRQLSVDETDDTPGAH